MPVTSSEESSESQSDSSSADESQSYSDKKPKKTKKRKSVKKTVAESEQADQHKDNPDTAQRPQSEEISASNSRQPEAVNEDSIRLTDGLQSVSVTVHGKKIRR